jgi:hypothetical protein
MIIKNLMALNVIKSNVMVLNIQPVRSRWVVKLSFLLVLPLEFTGKDPNRKCKIKIKIYKIPM